MSRQAKHSVRIGRADEPARFALAKLTQPSPPGSTSKFAWVEVQPISTGGFAEKQNGRSGTHDRNPAIAFGPIVSAPTFGDPSVRQVGPYVAMLRGHYQIVQTLKDATAGVKGEGTPCWLIAFNLINALR